MTLNNIHKITQKKFSLEVDIFSNVEGSSMILENNASPPIFKGAMSANDTALIRGFSLW